MRVQGLPCIYIANQKMLEKRIKYMMLSNREGTFTVPLHVTRFIYFHFNLFMIKQSSYHNYESKRIWPYL
ncbi:hypothetical protein RIR_jg38622.t1 [Rhizophagus irregularis DAOM 181602=DAOM 197198]|nr:hypothetical protein RIR_jg38622.t1 [Rhizophagus irregularis DAOM 181602=DAOM 197198]